MAVWGFLNHQQHVLQESQAEEAQEVGCLENHPPELFNSEFTP